MLAKMRFRSCVLAIACAAVLGFGAAGVLTSRENYNALASQQV